MRLNEGSVPGMAMLHSPITKRDGKFVVELPERNSAMELGNRHSTDLPTLWVAPVAFMLPPHLSLLPGLLHCAAPGAALHIIV